MMNREIKFMIFSILIFCVIFVIIWSLLNFTNENLYGAYHAIISGGLTAILAPRIEKDKSKSGSQMQLKWLFLKKPISI